MENNLAKAMDDLGRDKELLITMNNGDKINGMIISRGTGFVKINLKAGRQMLINTGNISNVEVVT